MTRGYDKLLPFSARRGGRQDTMARNSYYLFWGYYFAFGDAGQACFSR